LSKENGKKLAQAEAKLARYKEKLGIYHHQTIDIGMSTSR
jgi:hypothetical protein